MRFTKMHGLGNDYVYVDGVNHTPPADPARTAIAVSDRHFGIGSDGLILILPSTVPGADARMRMFNADGSESEMCGNGLRCVAKYVYDHGIAKKPTLRLETGRGVLSVELTIRDGRAELIQVDMGEPILQADQIPTLLSGDPPINNLVSMHGTSFLVTAVSMGNPHAVVYVDAPFLDTTGEDHVVKWGPRLENHPHFPRRVNVHFVQVISPTEVRMRTWERGSGITLACGTGACAVAVAGVLTEHTGRKLLAHLPGGDLQLEWSESTNHVLMTGPATEVFTGDWPGE
ncbi:MAG: diaminopimelate epimerase [Gemmataceae bacterium]